MAQIYDLDRGLQQLDLYITTIYNQLIYAHQRNEASFKTLQSTHSRAMYYALGVNGMIVAASLLQVQAAKPWATVVLVDLLDGHCCAQTA